MCLVFMSWPEFVITIITQAVVRVGALEPINYCKIDSVINVYLLIKGLFFYIMFVMIYVLRIVEQ